MVPEMGKIVPTIHENITLLNHSRGTPSVDLVIYFIILVFLEIFVEAHNVLGMHNSFQ